MSILINSLRFWDEEDYPQGHICMYVYEILSILSSAHAWTSVILAGERDSRRQSTTSFGENAGTSYQM